MAKHSGLFWADVVADRDYQSAFDYLSLRLDAERAQRAVEALQDADLTSRRANDLLRAARLSPAPLDDPGVRKGLLRIARGKPLSPVLCVAVGDGLEIADGFHRISLAYHLDPFDVVRLKLA